MRMVFANLYSRRDSKSMESFIYLPSHTGAPGFTECCQSTLSSNASLACPSPSAVEECWSFRKWPHFSC